MILDCEIRIESTARKKTTTCCQVATRTPRAAISEGARAVLYTQRVASPAKFCFDHHLHLPHTSSVSPIAPLPIAPLPIAPPPIAPLPIAPLPIAPLPIAFRSAAFSSSSSMPNSYPQSSRDANRCTPCRNPSSMTYSYPQSSRDANRCTPCRNPRGAPRPPRSPW